MTLHADGSVAVADGGRGTDTRHDADGVPVRKPVMATQDLRFFAAEEPPTLPDGHARRGMSVVSALSTWLVHTNHRTEGSWTQRYEHGVPVTDLLPVESDGRTGTTVHLLPDPALVDPPSVPAARLRSVTWPTALRVEVVDLRGTVEDPASP